LFRLGVDGVSAGWDIAGLGGSASGVLAAESAGGLLAVSAGAVSGCGVSSSGVGEDMYGEGIVMFGVLFGFKEWVVG